VFADLSFQDETLFSLLGDTTHQYAKIDQLQIISQATRIALELEWPFLHRELTLLNCFLGYEQCWFNLEFYRERNNSPYQSYNPIVSLGSERLFSD